MLEGIKEKRDGISAEIAKQQEEKYKLEQQIAALNDKLGVLNRTLLKQSRDVGEMQENVEVKNSYEKTITETESAYMKALLSCGVTRDRFSRARRPCCRCSSGRARL